MDILQSHPKKSGLRLFLEERKKAWKKAAKSSVLFSYRPKTTEEQDEDAGLVAFLRNLVAPLDAWVQEEKRANTVLATLSILIVLFTILIFFTRTQGPSISPGEGLTPKEIRDYRKLQPF